MPRFQATVTRSGDETQQVSLEAEDAQSARQRIEDRGYTLLNDPVEALEPMPQGDATGGVIPYKNVPALIAYYLGLFSLFPVLGFFLAVPAFILGILGLRKRKHQPEVKGSVHAWIGVVMGGLCSLIWGAVIVLIIWGLTLPA